MSAIRALIEALGADYGQWRGLVRPLIKVSFRAPLNPGPVARRKRKARLVSGGTLFLAVFCGLIIANTAGQLADPFPFSLLALNLLAIFVLVLRLQNFQAVTVSPKDYEALGHRPVSPRTYLLARLAVLMANQGIITAIMAGPVVLLSGLRFGWPPVGRSASGGRSARVARSARIDLGLCRPDRKTGRAQAGPGPDFGAACPGRDLPGRLAVSGPGARGAGRSWARAGWLASGCAYGVVCRPRGVAGG